MANYVEVVVSESVKVAVVIYEPIGSDMSRAYRGLKTALEFKKAGDDVVVLFDGSGVETLAAVSEPTSPLNPLITALADNVLGACSFCAKSHKVADTIRAAGWSLRTDDGEEASIRDLVIQGRTIISF